MFEPNFSKLLELPPYGVGSERKRKIMLEAMRELMQWHMQQCFEYRRVMKALNVSPGDINRLEDVPFLPVQLFKEYDLLSIPREEIYKTMTSSGTSGQAVSRIFLNRSTASLQIRVLSRLMTGLLGNKRLPMLVLDSHAVLKDRAAFSARGAGILGFSMFGLDVTYALDKDMQLDIEAVESFLERHPEGPIILFGFTFIIWQHLVKPLLNLGHRLMLDRGILLHGGGWKNLLDYSVDKDQFKQALHETAGLNKVVNYYGMVEQTGSIYMECERGHLHAPVFADVFIRRNSDFQCAKHGEEGIIEVVSILPLSYPGHALLTEDRGTIFGEDDCPCGRMGKYFHVQGRLAKAEVRGCSDTYETPR